MTTLRDIVNGALSSSEGALKLASARDAMATTSGLSFLDLELKTASDEETEEAEESEGSKKEKEKKEEKKKEASDTIVADADYAMKLAEALTLGSNILAAKLASNPEIHESGMQHPPTVPKAHSKVTEKITGPTIGVGGLPTTKADFTSTNDHSGRAKNEPGKQASWTTSKEASVQMMRTKMAQAEALLEHGQVSAAEKLLNEVREVETKLAEAGRLDTEPPASTHIGDNAALINLTRAQARDRTTKETMKYFSEPPKKDNAVAAHTLRTDGQKLSHLIVPKIKQAEAPPFEKKEEKSESKDKDDKSKDEKKDDKEKDEKKEASLDPALGRAYLAKLVKTASNPDAAPQERQKAASALQTIKSRLGMDPDALLS